MVIIVRTQLYDLDVNHKYYFVTKPAVGALMRGRT